MFFFIKLYVYYYEKRGGVCIMITRFIVLLVEVTGVVLLSIWLYINTLETIYKALLWYAGQEEPIPTHSWSAITSFISGCCTYVITGNCRICMSYVLSCFVLVFLDSLWTLNCIC